MASYASRLLSRPRARGAVVAIAAGCCALGCLSLPAAPADAKHVKAISPSVTSGEGAPVGHGKQAEQEASAEGSGAGRSAAPATAAPAAGHPEPAAAGHRRRARPARRPARSPAGGRLGEESAQSGDASAQRSDTLASQKKGTGRRERGRRTVSSSPRRGTAGAAAKQRAATEATEATALAAAVPASGASSAASSITPSTAATATAPAVAVHGRRTARRARHRGRTPAGSRAAVATAIAVPLPLAAVAAAKQPRAPARTAAKKTPAHTSQPALVKTITKIVGVVPTPVRILIGALVALALALGVRSRLAARRTRRLEHQRRRLLEDVGLLQAALLPVPPARLGPVGTTAAYRPADGPGAGGDFYDVFALEDGQLAVIVGDVSGHGRDALPHTALLRFTVRAYLEAGLSPRKALQTAGTVLERQLGESFATVVAATYHPRRRTLTYASAGHPPPVVIGQPTSIGEARTIEPVIAGSAPPIGAGMRTGTRQTVISVPGPAQLCFHTDGVTEARVGTELFGDARLAAALADLGREASAASLLDSVAERTDARPDDMAACLLRVEDGAGAPAILVEELELDRDTAGSARTERFLTACGVEPAEAAEIMRAARAQVDRLDTVVLELRFDGAAPVAALQHANLVHTAELAAASAS